MPVSAKSLDYCRNWVKNFEPIHYYVMKCMSKEIAIPYMVLQALNIELSRTRNVVTVSNPNLVRGKYTFWRSVVNGQETDHPIGAALLEIIRERNIPRDCLISIIDAKEADCFRTSFNTLDIFKKHYSAADGQILEALSRSVDPTISQPLVEGLRSLGVAQGVYRVLRNSTHARLAGLDPGFPLDLVDKHKIPRLQLTIRNPWMSNAQLRPLLKEFLNIGRDHLRSGNMLVSQNLPSDRRSSSLIKQLCLINVAVDHIFKWYEKVNYMLEIVPSSRFIKLWTILYYRRFTNSILRY